MRSARFLRAILSGLALATNAIAEPIPVDKLEPRQFIIDPGDGGGSSTITPGGPACGEHGPNNRRCWKNNWTIDKENEIDPPPALVSHIVT